MPSQARERVLATAEALFSERGYDSVTLRHIADQLGLRQASLYHHVPNGKEQLFVEVTERGLERHRLGLETAITAVEPDLRLQMRAAARWLLSQPPLNLSRLIRSDFPRIAPNHADRLFHATYASLLAPLERIFVDAHERGDIVEHQRTLLSASFLTLIEGIHDAGGGRPIPRSKDEVADEIIDVLLDGLRPR